MNVKIHIRDILIEIKYLMNKIIYYKHRSEERN